MPWAVKSVPGLVRYLGDAISRPWCQSGPLESFPHTLSLQTGSESNMGPLAAINWTDEPQKATG